MNSNTQWWSLGNLEEVDSPALLIYPDRARENVKRMIAMTGRPQRLWPHVKTHKLAPLVRMQLELGILNFKCATIAEAEMVAAAGAAEVLLAHQPVGPRLARFLELSRRFPKVRLSAIADDPDVMRAVSAAAVRAGITVPVLLDLDCGMHRTGVVPGPRAVELYRLLASLPGIEPAGLHVYDGHISDTDLRERERNCLAAFDSVQRFRAELVASGLQVPRMIAGGTPTFPIHARCPDVDCSPGTSVLWDAGYAGKCPDLDFLQAAVVLTRVVSKPGAGRLCLDLGHKAIASEMPHPRVLFPELPDATAVGHSEEHLVLETTRADAFPVGAALFGIPRHICPTVALHSHAVVVRNGCASEVWPIDARARRLTV